jgi:hypothetical protein
MIPISIMRKWLWVNSRDEVSVDFCLVKMGGCYQFPHVLFGKCLYRYGCFGLSIGRELHKTTANGV